SIVSWSERAKAVGPVIAASQSRASDAHDRTEHDLRESNQEREIAHSPDRQHLKGPERSAVEQTSASSAASASDLSSACASRGRRVSAMSPGARRRAPTRE